MRQVRVQQHVFAAETPVCAALDLHRCIANAYLAAKTCYLQAAGSPFPMPGAGARPISLLRDSTSKCWNTRMHRLTANHSAYLKRTGTFFCGFRSETPLAWKLFTPCHSYLCNTRVLYTLAVTLSLTVNICIFCSDHACFCIAGWPRAGELGVQLGREAAARNARERPCSRGTLHRHAAGQLRKPPQRTHRPWAAAVPATKFFGAGALGISLSHPCPSWVSNVPLT